jgi:hypothetical protein
VKLHALALLACAVPAVAVADPLLVTPSYVPRVHPPRHGAEPLDNSGGNAGYFYVAFGQESPMFGAGAKITQAQPEVSTADFHSLAEISVESDDGKQIIEIGWTVDTAVNSGSVEPHLFAFHWINGEGTCYNGCGWVQVSATHSPGMEVPADKALHSFQIEHRADARWWLTYDGDDMGYYPDTEWGGTYTEAGFTQWFGEVAAGSETDPCTQMGDGMSGSSSASAKYDSIYTIGAGSAQVPANVAETAETLPEAYAAGSVTGNSFRFGGFGIANPGCQYFVDLPPDDPAPTGGDVDTTGSAGGGCCDAGGAPGGSALLIGLVGLALWRRRR